MQNSNHFVEYIVDFLKSNNIKYQELIERYLNVNINSYVKDEVIKDEFKESTNDIEDEYEYQLLFNKLNDIQENMNQISSLISKNS